MKDENKSESASVDVNDKKTRRQIDTRDRVALNTDSVTKLSLWVEQLKSKRRGVVVNRKDLVNWLIGSHTNELSQAEEDELSALFYDELKALTEATVEMRAARLRGENPTLEELMGPVTTRRKVKRDPVKHARAAPKTEPIESVLDSKNLDNK